MSKRSFRRGQRVVVQTMGGPAQARIVTGEVSQRDRVAVQIRYGGRRQKNGVYLKVEWGAPRMFHLSDVLPRYTP
jgi:hypothetical protein